MMMSKNSGFAAVITAAGKSGRMKLGIKKEYLSIPDYGEGVTVISECLLKFLQTKLFEVLVITVPEKDISTVNNLIFTDKRIEKELAGRETKIILTPGADTRQTSVFNALIKLEEINEKYNEGFKYVLIHDGARPWVSCDLIKNVCSALKKHEAVIPGYPAIDTQKTADESGKITLHLKRSSIYSVQTPQGFDFEKILAAHKKAAGNGKEYTDDSEIYGEFAGDVFICAGEVSNKKITFKEDIK
ncbi:MULTISPECIES: IspD/TarI family cytidylyltransferase [unclassified Treponema]|uniref:IspD/TarI family cytidylyltransferase n=1 Tax=unclassified Treponema TaxID=2638727 RepID=UPI0020A4967C|nr:MULTISPECIES: IspD/TarI family cytidylyltransferase [unclassified Treponema]UTC66068.1 2-C-methyl-D-erythritol 4-phosphate cytidylyltransferase [Treponema sp. OMZ 789]UTC68798.1 2-C-methyl-D-erythritol 4-phosphate cytidylyltransferase [Treponema sp. OMZ 790]UTC71526.1 2-C-methyl-D-erythritol 4-phosphate cytidylyltransferase [Treponema sp. OMZ 791]